MLTTTLSGDGIYGAQDLKISHAHSLILSLPDRALLNHTLDPGNVDFGLNCICFKLHPLVVSIPHRVYNLYIALLRHSLNED